ncbi:MAG: hypothetical protein ACPGSB_02390 [Opitutales bacterium]
MPYGFLVNMRNLAASSAFLLAGAVIGMLLPFPRNVTEEPSSETGTYEMAYTEPSRNIDSKDFEAGALRITSENSESSIPLDLEKSGQAMVGKEALLQQFSGLYSPNKDGPLVVIPADFISELSRSGHIRKLEGKLFPADGKLAASLQIDEQEKTLLESNWVRFREQIRKLEADSASIKALDDGTLQIIMPELRMELAPLKDRFRATAIETIGDNRANVLFAASQLDSLVEKMGEARKMVVRAEETGNGGWRFRTEIEGPNGKHAFVGDKIPPAVRNLTGDLEMESF